MLSLLPSAGGVYYLQMILKADVPLRSTDEAYDVPDSGGNLVRCSSLQEAAFARDLFVK